MTSPKENLLLISNYLPTMIIFDVTEETYYHEDKITKIK